MSKVGQLKKIACEICQKSGGYFVCLFFFNCWRYLKFSLYFSRGRSPFGDPSDPNTKMLIGLIAGVGIVGLIGLYQTQYREITYKDFVNNYLARGTVSINSHVMVK